MGWPVLSDVQLRAGRMADIPELVALENRSFSTDRLAARNFRRFLRAGRSTLLVAELSIRPPVGPASAGHLPVAGRLAGYVLVLYRANTKAGRLYSIAVSEAARGCGVGDALLAAAERAAIAGGRTAMRLEVRPDNRGALRLYEKQGYRVFATCPGFYEDGTDALRLEKVLA